MNSDNFRVDTEKKDEKGEPVLSFYIDQNGQILDPYAQYMLREIEEKE